MLNAYQSHSTNIPSINPQKKENTRNSRDCVCIFILAILTFSVVFSSICIFKYALRDKAVYNELVDYLDKTVSISKINFNPTLGIYELRPNELEILGDQRKYKSLIWTFFFVDLSSLIFFGVSAFFFFSVNQLNGIIRALFWIFSFVGIFYSLIELGIFTTLISPYSNKLPNATIALLDHAIPYNPGGLAQIENRFSCIFDQNLYEIFKRHLNPKNTCDPLLLNSFIPNILLAIFISIRSLSVIILLILLFTPNSSINRIIVNLIIRLKPAIHYRKNNSDKINLSKNKLPSYYASPAKTTFGVKENSSQHSPLPIPPITPPIGHIDHSINYNNAALFAEGGGGVYGSGGGGGGGCGSRSCSDISIAKCGGNYLAQDLTIRGSTHTTNSLVSEDLSLLNFRC
ncbi:hypothetical protein Mgra_00000539 [Meloidogyne graminicola]|uniref:Uncharacterized protein n=1 Tax=Meloidogyne graminicola TaxID=189291 RepID=A0A8T0A5A0_9BILA|nr:hypothetical protein Mgra_00000539 [Meloidogyne graminicola]